MRLPCLLLAALLGSSVFAHADEQLVERFDGHASLTTADFTVPDGWEIRWRSNQVLSLGVIRRDNTVVAGTTGRNIGSLFLPQGGVFRIRVKGEDSIPWDVAVFALDKSAPRDGTASDFYAPTDGPAFKPIASLPEGNAAPEATAPATHVPLALPSIPTRLNAEQLHCLVAIKGDRAQGTGFFVKISGIKFIVTTQDLIADNPNWEILTAAGAVVKVTRIEGATDRNVVLLSVKDFGYDALDLADPGAIQAGDAVLTDSVDGTLPSLAGVTAIGPRRIEINFVHALQGCPVVLARSGQVVGMIATEPTIAEVDHFSDENFHYRSAAVEGSKTTFGLRLDNIPAREPYEPAKLQAQTQFLDSFHHHSRTLDAYLNGTGDADDARLWQSDDKIKSAHATFLQDSAGGDSGQRSDALRALLFELGLVADADLEQAEQPSNFYNYPRLRAKNEAAYREALKSELDAFSNNVSGMNGVIARNTSN